MTIRGEFSLIIATLATTGVGAGTVSADLADTITAFAVGYVLVMAVLGTTLMQYSRPFEAFVARQFDGEPASSGGD